MHYQSLRLEIVTLAAFPSLVAHCVVIWQPEMPPIGWGFCLVILFVFHWLPYYIQSTHFTRVPVMVDQPYWWVQTIRRIMLNTFVIIYCAIFRPIKISSVRLCSMDRGIILGFHKVSQLANIDYQWTLHIFQRLYKFCQLFPKAFFCDHYRLTENKMTDTVDLAMAYLVVYRLIIQKVWFRMGGLWTQFSKKHYF